MTNMNILDTITLLKAGYSKKEIEAMKEEQAKPVDNPPAAPAVDIEPESLAIPEAENIPDIPAADPRIAELEGQIKELQAKLIKLTAVDTAPKKDPLIDIANSIINGGK